MTYQWHVFLASLEPVQGAEQAGRRPVLVVSRERINQLLPVINVVPLTSRKSAARVIYPNEVLLPAGTAGLRVDSIALCYQIRTLDKNRLEQDMGELTDAALRRAIHDAMRFQLDMQVTWREYGALDTGTDKEVIESARYALRHGMPGGGYIFSTSNCIYTGMRLERYELMLDVWRQEGNYQAQLLDFSGGVIIMIISG